MTAGKHPIRVLVAKPGLDGHDVGAKLVCRALMEAGMEVVYTGLRQSPETIARAAAQESADAVGLSVLSGAHLTLTRRVRERLDAEGLRDVPLLVGGVLPARDHEALRAAGAAALFPTGARFSAIVEFVKERAAR